MAHDEPAGQMASRPGMTAPSTGPWNRWPPPTATSSHDQFFSVVKKVRPAPPVSGIGALSKVGPARPSPSLSGPKLKAAGPRPGPSSSAPVSLLKAGPLRPGFSAAAGHPAKTGPPKPGPSSSVAVPSKTGPPRPGPSAGVSPKVRHPSAGARPRAPSGGAPRPATDPVRPKPSPTAPKPRMSWDLDLLTDEPSEGDGDFATDLEQSPTFLTDNFQSRPGGASRLSLLGRVKTMGPATDKARDLFPKSTRGRKASSGEPRVPRKYVKKQQAANGSGGHAEGVSILHAKPKWKGATGTLRNDFGKVKQKRRRRKDKLIAVRLDGSVPHVVTLMPENSNGPAAPRPVVSPSKDEPGPKVAIPCRRPSDGMATDSAHGMPEAKPLFEHIDEDWAVIKKSLEKTGAKEEKKQSDVAASLKASPVSLTPSPSKKSDRSGDMSTDDDLGNDLNAPLHNLERLQDKMIQNLMDDGALAALKKRKRQKEGQLFKKRKNMSDYWKSKLGPGKGPCQMKMKRPYTVRPLTSDNVKHMEEAIAAVLAAPSTESPTNRRPAAAAAAVAATATTAAEPRPKSAVVPSQVCASPPPQPLQPPPPPAPHSAPAPRSSLISAAAPQPPPVSAAAAPAGGPERRVSSEPETDPSAAARLLQVKQDLAARFLSDLHQQRAQLHAAEQQRVALKQQQQTGVPPPPLVHRALIRVRHRRRRAGPPRVIRLSESAYLAGATASEPCVVDDGEDDGLAPPPEVASPPPATVPAGKVKEFLDSARVSRYRRTCSSGLLASVEMADDSMERMVFVSQRPLPPEVEQTVAGAAGWNMGSPVWQAGQLAPAPTTAGWAAGSPAPGAGWYGAAMSPANTTAGWSAEVMSPAASGAGWYGGMMSPAAAGGWFGGVMSPATGWPGQSPAGHVPGVIPGAESAPTPQRDAADVSGGGPLYISLPAADTSEHTPAPASVTPRTSVSPAAAVSEPDAAGRPHTDDTPLPGTPAGVSPRLASGTSPGAPSPRPADPDSLLFACNRCPARLPSLSEQIYHEIRLHMVEESRFRCLGCPMMLTLNGDVSLVLDGLLEHYLKHVDAAGRLLVTDTSSEFFRCDFCPRVFDDPAAYGAHEVQCRTLTHTCATCGGRFESGDVLKWHEVEHLRSADGKYCCDHCDSKFSKREQLLGHRRFHFKDKNVECPKCGKKFMTTGMLAMHNKWKHSQGPCRFCGRPFTSATARQAHEEHMHLKHMMHMCDVCHFRVMTASQLRVHKRTHSDDKPHRCDACDESFVSRNVLKKHRTARHAEGRPPPADGAAAEPQPAPAEPSPSQGGGESARGADGTLGSAELRQLFERYKATWTGPCDDMTLSDLDTEEDEEERRDLLDIQAKEELFKTKDKNTFSIWSCPVCKAFFTKLWGVRAHITLKHPGASVRPVLHDDKDTSAGSKQDFLKEIKRNAKTAKRELKLEAKRQARIAAYGNEPPRRGRPRKYPISERPPVVRKPVDPSQPRKRGRPRKNPDDATASPRPTAAEPAPPPPAPPPPPPKPEPPPDHVERRRWKCLTCEDQSQSYDDLVTHTYIAHPDADLPRFEVVVTYVPKPVPKAAAEPPPPPPAGDTVEAQQDRDAAILDAARVRGAEKRRAPSATKVPAGAKRRSVPSAAAPGGATRGRGRGRGGSGRGGRAGAGDSYRKSYSNSSRRYRADDEPEPAPAAAAAGDEADKLYCYCQSPYDEVSEMIGCDRDDCKHEWFHFECVGIVIAPKGKWFCPDCADKKGDK